MSISCDISAPAYTTDPHGARGGLAGWIRILRNGTTNDHVVHYTKTPADADEWIAQQVRV